jgi:hypothetical protein
MYNTTSHSTLFSCKDNDYPDNKTKIRFEPENQEEAENHYGPMMVNFNQ